jgi:hypothetical protein
VKNAYECKVEYSRDGKRLTKRERSIGPIVPWSIVALVALLMGRAVIELPPSFWSFFKR